MNKTKALSFSANWICLVPISLQPNGVNLRVKKFLTLHWVCKDI